MPMAAISRPSAMSTASTKPSEGIRNSEPMASSAPMPATMVPEPVPSFPSRAERTTRRNESGFGGAGGTCTYFLRPDQKITVAMNIRMPGMPNATLGP